MFPSKPLDIISPEGGCSGLDAFRFLFNWKYSTEPQWNASRNVDRCGLARSYQQEAKELLEGEGVMGEGWVLRSGRSLTVAHICSGCTNFSSEAVVRSFR